MTGTYIADGSVTNDRDFEAALEEAVDQATEAGVDVRGAWEFETAASVHRWEILVSELANYTGGSDGV